MNILKKIYRSFVKWFNPIDNNEFKITKDYLRTDYIFNANKPVIISKDSENQVFIDKSEHLEIKKIERTIENQMFKIDYKEETPTLLLTFEEKDSI